MRLHPGIATSVLLFTLALLASSVTQASALPPYKPPYVKTSVSGKVVAEYFDGSRLWVVYSSGEEAHIALYIYTGGGLVNSWISTVPGEPLLTAVTDDLSLLAVATSKKKIVVYDVSGRPVLMLERGVRGTPVSLSLAKLNDRYILLIIDRTAPDAMWAYAYDLEDHTARRAELYVKMPSYVPFELVPVEIAGRKVSLPQVAVVYSTLDKCNYTIREGNITINETVECSKIVIDILEVERSADGSLVFRNYTSGSVKLGYEIGREPFRVQTLDYVKVYFVEPLRKYYAVVGATLRQVYVRGVTSALLGDDIPSFFVIDVANERSITRYTDPWVGTLDFYIMGGSLLSFSMSYSGSIAAAGAQDYNLYILRFSSGYFYVQYSVSLGAPVGTVTVSSLGDLVLAGSQEGELYAIDVGSGDAYWSIPAATPVTSATLLEGYAAFGTEKGQVYAFINPRVKLYYLGIKLNLTNAPDYVIKANVSIRVIGVYDGFLVEENVTEETSNLVNSVWYTLLPSTNYTLLVDHLVLGVTVYSVSLSANVIYTIQAENFKLPIYNLTVCLEDVITGKPPAEAGVVFRRIPYPGVNETIATYTYPVPRSGCLYALLPRGYYTLSIVSWRYPPRIPGVPDIIQLWNNTVIKANVTPYIAPILRVRVSTSYGMALANASVTLTDQVSGYTISTTTTGSGEAIITNIPYGEYTVVVDYPYAYPARTSLRINESREYSLKVMLKPKSYIVSLIFVEAGSGAPVRPVTVTIIRPVDGFRIVKTLYHKNYLILTLEYGIYYIRANATGYKPFTTSIVIDKDTSLRLQLVPIYYDVTIRVVDALYQRPMGARILILNPYYASRSIVNAPNGFARVTLHAGNYTITVYPYHGYPASVNITVPATTSVLVQVEPKNYTVTVIPIDEPTRVKISRMGYRAWGWISCSDTGNWSLKWSGEALKATIPYSRGCRLHVSAQDYQPYSIMIGDITSNTSIIVALTPITYKLVIEALSDYNQPIDFNATVYGGPFNETYHAAGKNGIAKIKLRPGNYTLIVTARYHEPIVQNITIRNDTRIRVKLPLKVYRVVFNILDEDLGMPIEEAQLVIERIAPIHGAPEIIIVKKGVTTIPLTWGTYEVRVSAEGYEETRATIDVPETNTVVISLKPKTYTLVIKIADKLSGKPVTNATLELFGEKSGIRVTRRVEGGMVKLSLRSDTYVVIVIAPHYERYDTSIRLLSDTQLDIKLKPVVYQLRIRVYDGFTGKQYRGKFWVLLERLEGGYRENLTLTGPEVVVSAPYGTYRITIAAPRYASITKNIKLEQNIVDKPLDVMLSRVKYSVKVKVVDPRGPVQNAIIKFESVEKGVVVHTGITDENGEATASLPWGIYNLSVSAGGYHPYYTIVEVKKDNQLIPVLIHPTIVKFVLDLLPAIIIAGAVVGSAVWIGIRVRKKPVGLELIEEEEGE